MTGKISKRSTHQLPSEVHAALVETLFVTTGSFVAGLIGGVLVPTIAWLRSKDPIYLVCAFVVLLLTILRLVVFALHRAADEDDRRANAAYWEKLYAVAGISFMTSVGLTAAALCFKQHDAVTTLYGVVMTLGFAGALAGRNAGRPFIVYGQVLGVCLPLVAVFLFHHNSWYMGVSAMLVLVIVSTRSTTMFLNSIIVSALVNGREALLQRMRFGTALDNMSHGLCMADEDGVIIVINRRLREFFHLPADLGDITARELAEMIAASGRMSPQARKGFVAAWEAQVAKNEPLVFSETIAGRLYDFRCEPSKTTGVVFIVEDVTEARIASRQIEHMAHFDALTGLPNRMHFHNQLEARLAKAAQAGKRLALLSVDLDQFKEVNDTRGHPTGDALLRLVAKRLRQSVKNADLVARFGGDEFQVLMQLDSPGERGADFAAERMIQALSASYTIDGQIITIGASVGIAFTSEAIATADELLRCADLALYRAKADGKGVFRHFSPQLDVAVRRKREIEQDLRDAIANDTLELHYQPIIDVRTGQVVVCEALVRMRHPEKGMIPPDEFISIAEETGLIVQLGDWVLRRACAEAVHWPRWVNVAVNFSAKQFVLRRNIVDDILLALDEAGLDPSRLEVEITESTIIEAKDARDQLQAISAAGIKISLDDFGTGYSSLSYLRQFPVDKIKIDRSFAEDIHSRAAQAVIGSVSVLGHLLGVQVVMEGIETEDQLDAMRSWKVHLVQGYLFSRPQTQPATMELLLRNQPFPTAARLMTAREQLQSLEAFLNDRDAPTAAELRREAKKEERELRRAAAVR
jgi:diguanylate cyclase (GGDEF)-like protein